VSASRVSAIIPNYNSGADLLACVKSLTEQSTPPTEIIVVDNGSRDGSLERALGSFPQIRAVRNLANDGPAAAANKGAALARGELLLFLNPDVLLSPSSVALLANRLESGAGVAGPTHIVGTEMRREYGSTVDRLGHPTGLFEPGQPLFFPGATLATNRRLFSDLSGFDERFFMFAEDLDYCWRVLLVGGDVAVVANAEVIHRGGGSTPGGYLRGRQLETTSFRLRLRERNTFATFLKCAPVSWLPWFVPAHVLKTAALATMVLSLRKVPLAGGLLAGIVWNIRELRDTLRLRRSIVRTSLGERTASERFYRGFLELELVRRFGLPRFVDSRV
jgi:GT2 family glycosyltransferase